MNDRQDEIKGHFDEARQRDEKHVAEKMNEAERARRDEILKQREQRHADEVDRYEVEGAMERLGERNRILLEQVSPELRPDGAKRRPMSFEDVCALAQDICDRRHQVRLHRIDSESEVEHSDLQKEVTERIARESEQAKDQDLGVSSDREPDAQDHDADNDFGGFYRGSDDRDGGRDR